MKRGSWLAALGILLAAAGAAPARAALDTHAHVFFFEGTGLPPLHGFKRALSAKTWEDRIATKVNAEALNASGARLVVVALYAHPLYWVSERESIRRQLAAAEDFVKEDPRWGIARSSGEARLLLSEGKKVLVLSLEGASGILENEADLKEFVEDRAVAIVTPLHFSDDDVGGAAFMPGFAGIASPWAWLRSLVSPTRDAEGIRVNPQSLRPRGEWLIGELLKRRVWLDLAHASDATQDAILRISSEPVLYTHTMVRRYYDAERGISRAQLARVASRGGFVGVLPSEDTLVGTVIDPSLCGPTCGACQGGVPALLQQFTEIAKGAGGLASVSLGSDIQAPLKMLPPDCGEPRDYRAYDDLSRLWTILRERAGYRPDEALERFLQLWAKVRP